VPSQIQTIKNLCLLIFGEIKSLGALEVIFCNEQLHENPSDYFISKGYKTIILTMRKLLS
jgi:hypothetical protein